MKDWPLDLGKALLQTVVENLADGVCVLDASKRIRWVNTRFLAQLSLSADDLIGKSIDQVFPVVTASALDRALGEASESGEKCYSADYWETKDHRRLWFEMTVMPLDGATIVRTVDRTDQKVALDGLCAQEERYRLLVDSVPHVVCVVRTDGTFLFINTPAAKQLGGKPQDFLGKKMWDLFPGPHAEDQMSAIREVVASGTGERVVKPTLVMGQTRWYETRIEPLKSSGAEVNSALVIAEDITEHRRAEEEIRRQALVFETMHDGVILTDDQDLVVDWNPGAQRVFGYTKQEMIGRSPELLNLPQEGGLITTGIREAIKLHGRWASEVTVLHKDGTERIVEAVVVPVRTQDGKHVGNVSVNRDVTTRVHNEAKAKQHEADLARLSHYRALGEMAAGLAHELNQPLTALTSYVRGCLRRIQQGGTAPADLCKAMQQAIIQAERASDIITGVRDLVKPDQGQRVIARLEDVIAQVIDLNEIRKCRNDAELRVCLAGDLPCVRINVIQIEQVLVNLLANAFQAATATVGRTPFVKVQTAVDGDRVVVSISDNGCGIDMDRVGELFQPFRTTKTNGLGMGLSICRSIVEQHGGSVSLVHSDCRGTEFAFDLPAYKGIRG